MFNGFFEGLRASFAAVAIATVLFFATTVLGQNTAHGDPAGEFVEINAEIEILSWGGGLDGEDGLHPETFQIHVVVGKDKWAIGELFSGQTNYYSFDGTEISEWTCSFGTNGSTGNRWTRRSKSSDGNPSETVRASDRMDVASRIAWLALCSPATLNNPNHKLYPPWEFWKEFLDPSTFVEKLTRFEDDLGVPKTLLLFSGEHQLVVDYRVSATTNVAGWLFPESFYLLQYNPNGIKGWTLILFAHGRVSSIAPTADPFPTNKTAERSQGHAVRFASVSPSKVHIQGSSDVHDWSLDTTNVVGFLELNQELFNSLSQQSSRSEPSDLQAQGEFLFPVRHFSSGLSAPMFSVKSDQAVLHHALKTTDNPNVVYRLNRLRVVHDIKPEPSGLVLQSTGELIAGGVTNLVSFPFHLSRQDDVLKVSGSTAVKLSEFGIEPPSARGKDWVVKVGDAVECSFNLVLKKSRSDSNP